MGQTARFKRRRQGFEAVRNEMILGSAVPQVVQPRASGFLLIRSSRTIITKLSLPLSLSPSLFYTANTVALAFAFLAQDIKGKAKNIRVIEFYRKTVREH
jgi:hypothetical protein